MEVKPCFNDPTFHPKICPTLSLGEMLDRLNTMLGEV